MSDKKLTQLVVQCTDEDILLWGDLQEDGCCYCASYGEDKLTVYCCGTAHIRRSLWYNDEQSSLGSSGIAEICKAIGKQKVRLAAKRQATDDAIISLMCFRNSLNYV